MYQMYFSASVVYATFLKGLYYVSKEYIKLVSYVSVVC